jgi:short-subunit dehydrogenase
MNGKTALVTGASGGIGLELAKLLAEDGYNLVLVARSAQKLDELARDLRQICGVDVLVIACDLSDPAAPQQIWAALQARDITVDLLVNNAGYGIHGNLADSDTAEILNMIQLNVVALTHLTRLFLPGMIARRSGRILNVGSTGSFAPCPSMAVYSATKAYVLSFSQAIQAEVAGSGVSVTALCPGATATGFQSRAGVENTRISAQSGLMTAQKVAEIGYAGLKRGRAVVIPGTFNWWMIFFTRFSPRAWTTRIAGLMMETPGS